MSEPPPAPRRLHATCHTHTLPTWHCHMQLFHTQLVTHTLATQHCHTHTTLSHSTLSHTHNSFTHNLSYTHTHCQHLPTQHCHTHTRNSFTYNIVTHTHTRNSSTQHCHAQLFHTQFFYTQLVIHSLVTHNSFTHNIVAHNRFCVAGVALGDIDVPVAGTPRCFCVTGLAFGKIDGAVVWQVWHFVFFQRNDFSMLLDTKSKSQSKFCLVLCSYFFTPPWAGYLKRCKQHQTNNSVNAQIRRVWNFWFKRA